jgi:hypothetical protein
VVWWCSVFHPQPKRTTQGQNKNNQPLKNGKQAREASLGLAVANDIVYAVPLPDVLRGELRGLGLLQTALEQALTFQDKG